MNNILTVNVTHDKYKETGWIAFKMHSLDDKPEQEKCKAAFKNIRIAYKNPEKFVQEIDMPVVVTL